MRPAPGVWLLDATSRTGTRDQLDDWRRAGWQVVTLTGGRDLPEVLEGLGRVLTFPDYYGVNLDALADCLADLAHPTVVVWVDWQDLAHHRPEDWTALTEVLVERAGECPGFAVLLA